MIEENDDREDDVPSLSYGVFWRKWLFPVIGGVAVGVCILLYCFGKFSFSLSWSSLLLILLGISTVILWRIRLYGQAINCILLMVVIFIIIRLLSKIPFIDGLL